MDKCRSVEEERKKQEWKKEKNKREKYKEKRRSRWTENFASIWKRRLEVNQPNGDWFSLMLFFSNNELLWIGHNNDSHQTTNACFKLSKLLPHIDRHKTSISLIYKEAVDRASIYVTTGFFNTLGGMSWAIGSVFFKGRLSTISTVQKNSWRLKTPYCWVFMPLSELILTRWFWSCPLYAGLFFCHLPDVAPS